MMNGMRWTQARQQTRMLVTLALLSCLPAVLTASSVAPEDLATPVQLTTDPSDQRHPVISGSRIIWEDNRHGNSELYGCALTAEGRCGAEIRLTTNDLPDLTPTLAGNRLVWKRSQGLFADIYTCIVGADGRCGEERAVTTNSDRDWNPQTNDTMVVWTRTLAGNKDLYACTLDATGRCMQEQRLTTDPAVQINPALSGSNVVWEDRRNGQADLYLCTLASDARCPNEVRLTYSPADQRTPLISGSHIVWAESKGPNLEFYGCTYNPTAQACPAERLTVVPGSRRFSAGTSQGLSGATLVHGIRHPEDETGLLVYDWNTQTEAERAVAAGERTSGVWLSIDGSRLVWEQKDASGRWDVYLAQLGELPFDYTLTADPSTIAVAAGQSGISTLTVTRTQGTAQPVTLSAIGLPAGATPSFSRTTCTPTEGAGTDTCTSTLTLTTTTALATGTYPFMVTGSPLEKQLPMTLSVGSPPDTTPPAVTATHSPDRPTTQDRVTLTATASDANGIASVALTLDGASVQTCTTTPATSPVTCGYTTPSGLSVGSHAYFATATDASPQTNVGRDPVSGAKNLTVELPLDYSLSLEGSDLLKIIQGSSISRNVVLTLVSGTTQSVTLQVSDLPEGVSASWANNPCRPDCTSRLTLTASPNTPTGNTAFSMTGTPLGKRVTPTLRVVAPLEITEQPTNQRVLLGNAATFRVMASGTGLLYQWQQQEPAGTDWSDIPNATSATYGTPPTQLAHSGRKFRVHVRAGAGQQQDSASATLTVDRYNFVVILTDDQRWDTLTMQIGDRLVMPNTNEVLVSQGVNFTNAFVTDPLCCPDRASILSGGFYPHHTGVMSNGGPNGGAPKFQDAVTLATLLQQAGYKTAMIGKYLNNYNALAPNERDPTLPPPAPPQAETRPIRTHYIPPGWTIWVGKENSGGGPIDSWMNFSLTVGGSGQAPSREGRIERSTTYLTDFLRGQAVKFIDESSQQPFFLYWAPEAPHGPATPAPQDEHLFNDFVYRGRGYDQSVLKDPAWADWVRKTDAFSRNQLRSLQAVDRAVKAIVDQVKAEGVYDRTVFIFTSDNGYLWGEHRLTAKWKPQEESIRVPMTVVMPGVTPRSDDHLVVSNLDIGPTLFALAGIDKTTDGRDLTPLLKNPTVSWREDLLVEDWFTLWAGLHTKKGSEEWKYVEHGSGQKELYNLVADPYELTDLSTNSAYQPRLNQLAQRLRPLKGLAIIPGPPPPSGKVGTAYTFQLNAWGGKPPYTWSIMEGSLPDGLTLNSANGLISGMPRKAQEITVSIKVEDTTNPSLTQTGKPQSFVRNLNILIEPKQYNIVLFLTDDQRWDTIGNLPNAKVTDTGGALREVMPKVNDWLVDKGVHFTEAFVTTPLCCPDRASVLAGGFYSHNTSVRTNGGVNGGAKKFQPHDAKSIAVKLQQAGYRTAHIGKYLNEYNALTPNGPDPTLPPEPPGARPIRTTYVPPGWTMWMGKENSGLAPFDSWNNFSLTVGSSQATSTVGHVERPTGEYLTDFLSRKAVEFINEQDERPFFIYWTPDAPHGPATPAPIDATLFRPFVYRGRAWMPLENQDAADDFHRNQLRSLQAVDRAVDAIITAIGNKGKLQDTVFMFTSDNGYLWGEHQLTAKQAPYEESIRVPMVVRMLGVDARTDSHLVASNLDTAATIFDLADIEAPTDGRSLVPLLRNPEAAWRNDLLIEGYYGTINSWAGLRSAQWKYVEYTDGRELLFDLLADPYEVTNLASDPGRAEIRASLAARLDSLKGVAITRLEPMPVGAVGMPYEAQLTAWGGQPPYQWSLVEGQALPAGLRLQDNGVILGTPTTPVEDHAVSIKVRDASTSIFTGQPHEYIHTFKLDVRPVPDTTAPMAKVTPPLEDPTTQDPEVFSDD